MPPKKYEKPASMAEMLQAARSKRPAPVHVPDPYDGRYAQSFVRFTSHAAIIALQATNFITAGEEQDEHQDSCYTLDDKQLVTRLTRAVQLGRGNGAQVGAVFESKTERMGIRDYEGCLGKCQLPPGARLVHFCFINQKEGGNYLYTNEEVARLLLVNPTPD